jgi:hypothetical protein
MYEIFCTSKLAILKVRSSSEMLKIIEDYFNKARMLSITCWRFEGFCPPAVARVFAPPPPPFIRGATVCLII